MITSSNKRPKSKCEIPAVSISKEDVDDSWSTSFMCLKEHNVIARNTSWRRMKITYVPVEVIDKKESSSRPSFQIRKWPTFLALGRKNGIIITRLSKPCVCRCVVLARLWIRLGTEYRLHAALTGLTFGRFLRNLLRSLNDDDGDGNKNV